MTRRTVVAGQFYTSNESLLRKQLSSFTAQKKEKLDALGVVSPHAGYVYSGGVAGATLSSINPRSTYIILGTNHTGRGKPFGLDTRKDWETPLGKAKIDTELTRAILKDSSFVEEDSRSHDYEHSIEVQLPFLQYLNKDFTFAPITISHADKKTYETIGKELARAVKRLKKDVTFIASSDMTHYEPHDAAEKKDKAAIEKILALDLGGLVDVVNKQGISMCGIAPTAVMMAASVESGGKQAKLIKYETSAKASGDYSAVVGYAGIVVY